MDWTGRMALVDWSCCIICCHLQKNTPWLSVPQFGDWDQKGVMPDYSMDFTKIREMRKQNKRDPSRASLGNEEELISSATSNSNNAHTDDHHHFHQNHSPTVRFLTCLAFVISYSLSVLHIDETRLSNFGPEVRIYVKNTFNMLPLVPSLVLLVNRHTSKVVGRY